MARPRPELDAKEEARRVEQDRFVIAAFACRPSQVRPIKRYAASHHLTFSNVVRQALFFWWEQVQASMTPQEKEAFEREAVIA